jgi:lipoprotein signal peptidase
LFDRLQDTCGAVDKTEIQKHVMRVVIWKQTGVAFGCVLGRRHDYFTWETHLITTFFVFAVLEIPTRSLSKKRTPKKCVFYDISYHKIYGIGFLNRSINKFHIFLGTPFELFKPHCPEYWLISSSRN